VRSIRFDRVAGWAAIAAAVGGFAYSVAFTTFLKGHSAPAAKIATVLLFGGGLVLIVAWVGISDRLRAADPGFGLLALIMGVIAAAGAAVHGAYDLANFVKPPANLPADVPNAIDPRGMMTFGVAGLAILVASYSIVRGGGFSRMLAGVGTVAGILLIVVYLGRLIILDPNNPALLAAAVVSGFLVTPLWFALAGRELLGAGAQQPGAVPPGR
jgi:hypothetical protein